jgi:hypothetical protein
MGDVLTNANFAPDAADVEPPPAPARLASVTRARAGYSDRGTPCNEPLANPRRIRLMHRAG